MAPSKKPRGATDAPGFRGAAGGEDEPIHPTRTPVVGIGASAGGLEALQGLFRRMPSDTGLAFVVIQHLDPNRESMMASLLDRCTEMSVEQAEEGMEVEPDHVYVIPPGVSLTVAEGVLHLAEPKQRRGVRMPIDQFFRSLAEDQQERAIGIILSGTASEGSQGLREIKAHGGMVMVQDPATAQHDGMPRNAIATGLVDYVLPVEEMPEVLLGYVGHSYFREGPRFSGAEPPANDLEAILSLLRVRTGHDFRGYKRSTILRRTQRRMGLRQIERAAEYLELLRRDSDEVKALFHDLLVKVTSFFREPEAWQALEELVIPRVVEAAESNGEVRVWVPACSVGMEAYSLAILVAEELDRRQARLGVKIFATDLDPEVLERGRAGRYGEEIAADVSPERLKRFFTAESGGYQVSKRLREMVVFAPQNLLGDPPFSRLDLISCRNLLIYIDGDVHRRLVPIFHFALRDDGYLFLGSAENVSRKDGAFETVSKKWRIFRKAGPIAEAPQIPPMMSHAPVVPGAASAQRRPADVGQLANSVLSERYAPAALLVNRDYDIVYLHGDTEPYLRHPPGEPTRELGQLVREQLRGRVRGAVHHVLTKGEPVLVRATLGAGEDPRAVHVSAVPVETERTGQDLVLVAFEPAEEGAPAAPAPAHVTDEGIVQHLEYELRSTREELQSTIEELETSNEELKASNEEVMSMNEELQSTNEELETSKEELQSINEELSTVNAQLQEKVEELETTTDDLSNLLASTQMATLFLDPELRIRRFTPACAELLNIIPGDIGRPLSDIASEVNDPTLGEEARRVLDRLAPVEREVEISDGRWFLRRILPYRTADNRIEGVVLTFTDVSGLKRAEEVVRQSEERLRMAMDAAGGGYWELRVDPDDPSSADNLFVSPHLKHLAGLQEGSDASSLALWRRLVHPEDRERAEAAIAACLNGGLDSWADDLRLVRHDGTVIWLAVRGEVRREAGERRPCRWLGVAWDVTTAKEAEAARAHLAAVVESSSDAVVSEDLDGTVRSWNPAAEAMLGWTADEMIGRSILDIVPEEEREGAREAIARVAGGGTVRRGTVRLHRDGGAVELEVTVSPIRDDDGRTIGLASNGRDIRQRRDLERRQDRLNEELEERVAQRTEQLRTLTTRLATTEQRERSELARVLHDGLQQQVIAARLRTKLAMERIDDEVARGHMEEARTVLERAVVASQHLVAELAPPAVERAGLAAGLRWLAGRLGERFGLKVEVDTGDELPPLPPTRRHVLLRAVRELLTNVAKHSGVEHAEVAARVVDGILAVKISDRGTGFDTAVIGTPGSGFGLLSVREQVTGLGGSVAFESAPGDGTRVVIRMPVGGEDEIGAEATPGFLGEPPEPRDPVRVLLVDDDEDLRRGLVDLLGAVPEIEVVGEAASGERAFDLAHELDPDVVLMDVSMVGIGGVEATRLITEDMPRVTVYGLSMHTDRKVVLEMRGAGAAGYFAKGGDEGRLVAAILKAGRR